MTAAKDGTQMSADFVALVVAHGYKRCLPAAPPYSTAVQPIA